MMELYKVRNIKISLLEKTTHESLMNMSCEYGMIYDKEGIIFLDAHIFNEEDFAKVFQDNLLGCPANIKMLSFDGTEIEAPNLALTGWTTKENKVTFKCFGYITINEEDGVYAFQKRIETGMLPTQLLRVDFWGLDLLITSYPEIRFMVNDAPFDIQLHKDEETNEMYATFPINKEVAHNTLTFELFQLFRNSLIGYLSLINGARVQIVKEYYNSFYMVFSYNRIENISCSYYACGNAKVFHPNTILCEFDNYIRWEKILDLNKFIHHLCSAQQEIFYEDSAFILILVFEGLSKKYLDIHEEETVSKTIIPQDSFEKIKRDFNDIVSQHDEISSIDIIKFKNAINRLNYAGLAIFKFFLIIDELNIQRTKEIEKLIYSVRNVLVHEAELKDYSNYVLLSELIREIILRLINSTVERHSSFENNVIKGEIPNLHFCEFIKKNKLNVNEEPLFTGNDKRIKLWQTINKRPLSQ